MNEESYRIVKATLDKLINCDDCLKDLAYIATLADPLAELDIKDLKLLRSAIDSMIKAKEGGLDDYVFTKK